MEHGSHGEWFFGDKSDTARQLWKTSKHSNSKKYPLFVELS